ncbi:MAG: hypothetical protein GY832_22125 [Chloroflexi bacterium]|nr:hypothetical protein [Chloroflexota bacterium]
MSLTKRGYLSTTSLLSTGTNRFEYPQHFYSYGILGASVIDIGEAGEALYSIAILYDDDRHATRCWDALEAHDVLQQEPVRFTTDAEANAYLSEIETLSRQLE